MRTLILMRGAPGSGKSTFVEKNGLLPFTISPDILRLLIQAPEMTLNSSVQISNSNDSKVWKTLFELLENRMKNGDLTVIDAAHTTTKDINQYRQLSNKYRYHTICVDFGYVALDSLVRHNKMRDAAKVIPQNVIENLHHQATNSAIPSWVTKVTPEDFNDFFQYKPRDLSHYRRIHHFGDIHGCFDALSDYLKEGIKDDEFYIFVGDYIDRGIQNGEVLDFLFTLMHRENVIFLEGNHEIHLWNWANDKKSFSREFETYTKKELNKKMISKKTSRLFYRSLNQCFLYTYVNKQVLVTHGGLSYLPENLSTVSTQQLIKGVGNNTTPIDELFHKNTNENTFQIHGHRNIQNFPAQVTERTFNLEGRIELGGHLRVATLEEKGFHTHEIKNNKYSERFSLPTYDMNLKN